MTTEDADFASVDTETYIAQVRRGTHADPAPHNEALLANMLTSENEAAHMRAIDELNTFFWLPIPELLDAILHLFMQGSAFERQRLRIACTLYLAEDMRDAYAERTAGFEAEIQRLATFLLLEPDPCLQQGFLNAMFPAGPFTPDRPNAPRWPHGGVVAAFLTASSAVEEVLQRMAALGPRPLSRPALAALEALSTGDDAVGSRAAGILKQAGS